MRAFEGLTIDDLIEKAKGYLPDLDKALISDAYSFAEEVHDEDHVIHLLETTYLLLDLKPDQEAILVSLLHDVPFHVTDGLLEVEKRFGSPVRDMIRDARKLRMVRAVGTDAQAEARRRMFLAMAKDLRVVFVRIADCLHNMMTLDSKPEEVRQELAKEAMDVYVPIASRLGVYRFKSALEDLVFKHLNPEEHDFLKEDIEKYGEMRQKAIDDAIADLKGFLKKNNIEAEVKGRIKHIFSIHSKLKRKGVSSLNALYDIYALRVILEEEDISQLYTVLGLIHQKWKPLTNRFKDYVAVPKPNGYRSLHTAVLGLVKGNSQPVEIQIRTRSMHDESRYGVAAHWWYKEGAQDLSQKISSEEFQKTLSQYRVINKLNGLLDKSPEIRHKIEGLIRDGDDVKDLDGLTSEDLEILRKSRSQGALMTRHKDFQSRLEWIDGLSQSDLGGKLDLFSDRIFVLTPHGEVKDLPKGATPVDFAYAVHTDVGNCCHQAKVDGKIVPLDYELQNGGVVEILTKKEPKPNRYWLSFVKTSAAANKIKGYFRSFDSGKNIKEGRELLNKYLERLGKAPLSPKLSILKNYGGKKLTMNQREEILEALGNGTLGVGMVIKKIFPEGGLIEKKEKEETEKKVKDVKDLSKLVLVGGHDNLPVVLSACCKPQYGQSIVGYVTRGKQIRVHKESCGNLRGLDESRVVSVDWKSKVEQHSYQAELYVEAEDRVGLLSDIASVIDELKCNIANITVDREGGQVIGKLSVEVGGYDELEKLLDRIEGVPGVKKAGVSG